MYHYHLDPAAATVLARERTDRLRRTMIASRRAGELESGRRQPARPELERLLGMLASARRTVL